MDERAVVLWLRRVAAALEDALEAAKESLPEEAVEEREVRNVFGGQVSTTREAPALDDLYEEVADFRREIDYLDGPTREET